MSHTFESNILYIEAGETELINLTLSQYCQANFKQLAYLGLCMSGQCAISPIGLNLPFLMAATPLLTVFGLASPGISPGAEVVQSFCQGRPGGVVVYPKKIRQNTQKYAKFIQIHPKLYPGILYT